MTDSVNQENITIAGDGDIAARDVIKPTYNYGRISTGGYSQLEKLYEKFREEREKSTTFDDVIEELLHYKGCPSNTIIIGLEEKLHNGNRSAYLRFAESSKDKFTRKLLKNEHSETAQEIYAFLLAKVYSNFETYIYPRLNEGHPDEFINNLVSNYIIKPIEDILGDNLLRIYEDDINGMIYFLTGNCHIKWN